MDDPTDVPIRNELKKTIELTCFTRIDPEALKSLQWDLAFELRKSLRPSVIRELTKKEPHRALYEETWPDIIAGSLVKRIVDTGWYVKEVSHRSMVHSELPISVLFHSQDGAHLLAVTSDWRDPAPTSNPTCAVFMRMTAAPLFSSDHQ